MKTLATLLAVPLMASAALSAMPAAAQEVGAVSIAPGHTLLTVTGEGESMREPDIAMFTAGVSTSGKTAGEALAANSTQMDRVIAALKRAGVADRDIQTSNLNLSPVYADRRPAPDGTYSNLPPEIVGYTANNIVTVKQRRIDQFGRLIDTLVSSGANNINGPNFMLDKPEPAQDEARVQAVAKARARAELYARAAGLRIVRIVSINESGGWSRPPVVYARMAADAAAPPPPPPAPIAPGELSLSQSVTMQFELAP